MKPLFKSIAVFLLLGFVTTVAVAWGLAISSDVNGAPRMNFRNGFGMTEYFSPQQGTAWVFNSARSTGLMHITSANHGPHPGDGSGSIAADHVALQHDIPSWSVMRHGDPVGIFNALFIEEACGWPMLAMTQRHRFGQKPAPPTMDVDGLHLSPDLQRFGPGAYLPLRFIWPGALIDSAIFGWFYFSIFAFPGIVIRSRRRQRGACPRCGYDLRGAEHEKCPECGAAIVPSKTPSQPEIASAAR